MSLSVGKFFYKALSEDTTIADATEGRIFPVARTTEDEKEDKIPYIIIMPSGVQNQTTTKDDVAESQWDTATVTLMCVASSYSDLVDLTEAVRSCIKSAMEDEDFPSDTWAFSLDDYTFSADAVQYDPSKPCHYQALTYVCDTTNK